MKPVDAMGRTSYDDVVRMAEVFSTLYARCPVLAAFQRVVLHPAARSVEHAAQHRVTSCELPRRHEPPWNKSNVVILDSIARFSLSCTHVHGDFSALHTDC